MSRRLRGVLTTPAYWCARLEVEAPPVSMFQRWERLKGKEAVLKAIGRVRAERITDQQEAVAKMWNELLKVKSQTNGN